MISENDIAKMILGFKIRHLRTQKKISYQELAARSGLSVSYLNDIEKGKKYPKPDKVRALAQAFQISYDDLIGTKADKRLLPVVDLLNSGFFRYFPAEEFGVDTEKLIDFFSGAPDRISAFISTMLKMVRSYQIEKEHFYKVALRSYQDMHDNYFPDIENSVIAFRKEMMLEDPIVHTEALKNILKKHFNIEVDIEVLSNKNNLKNFRSYFSKRNQVLYVNSGLDEVQQRFHLAKEIGFQVLDAKERSFETQLNDDVSFEKLLNNFKASYFAAALLLDADEMVRDINKTAREVSWSPSMIEHYLVKYQVTPETLLQRFTNLFPRYFGIGNLFFIRLNSTKSLIDYRITKELHLSELHKPYQNQLSEHLCQRWVSISTVKAISGKEVDYFIDAQVSQYWNSDNAYFCISIAQPSRFDNKNGSSVTLGLAMNDALKGAFNFMKDPNLRSRHVHTTCERCGITDCDNRVAPPSYIERKQKEAKLAEELRGL